MNKSQKIPFLQKVITLFTKHSFPVITLIIIITVFFGYHATKLQIDANIFAFSSNAPSPQEVLTPEIQPAKELELKGIKATNKTPQRGEIVTFEHTIINN